MKGHPYLENILNFDISLLENKIFRIERFSNLSENLKQNQLSFSHPEEWPDIFDSIFVRTPVKIGGLLVDQAYKDHYFCQCWNTKGNELMWSLYSAKECHDGQDEWAGIMLESSIGRIMRSIWDSSDRMIRLKRYVGEMEYCPIGELMNEHFFAGRLGGGIVDPSGRRIARTFLYKRDFFSYENEVRFIACEKNGVKRNRVNIKAALAPRDYINRVFVDPRASDAFFRKAKGVFREYGLEAERFTLDIAPSQYTFPGI